MTKRMLSLLLALVMTLSLCVPALAADEFAAEAVTEVEEQAPEAPEAPVEPEAEEPAAEPVAEEAPVEEIAADEPEIASIEADEPYLVALGVVSKKAHYELELALETAEPLKEKVDAGELYGYGELSTTSLIADDDPAAYFNAAYKEAQRNLDGIDGKEVTGDVSQSSVETAIADLLALIPVADGGNGDPTAKTVKKGLLTDVVNATLTSVDKLPGQIKEVIKNDKVYIDSTWDSLEDIVKAKDTYKAIAKAINEDDTWAQCYRATFRATLAAAVEAAGELGTGEVAYKDYAAVVKAFKDAKTAVKGAGLPDSADAATLKAAITKATNAVNAHNNAAAADKKAEADKWVGGETTLTNLTKQRTVNGVSSTTPIKYANSILSERTGNGFTDGTRYWDYTSALEAVTINESTETLTVKSQKLAFQEDDKGVTQVTVTLKRDSAKDGNNYYYAYKIGSDWVEPTTFNKSTDIVRKAVTWTSANETTIDLKPVSVAAKFDTSKTAVVYFYTYNGKNYNSAVTSSYTLDLKTSTYDGPVLESVTLDSDLMVHAKFDKAFTGSEYEVGTANDGEKKAAVQLVVRDASGNTIDSSWTNKETTIKSKSMQMSIADVQDKLVAGDYTFELRVRVKGSEGPVCHDGCSMTFTVPALSKNTDVMDDMEEAVETFSKMVKSDWTLKAVTNSSYTSYDQAWTKMETNAKTCQDMIDKASTLANTPNNQSKATKAAADVTQVKATYLTPVERNWNAFLAALKDAKAVKDEGYTYKTWGALQVAIEDANKLYGLSVEDYPDKTVQSKIDAAAKALTDAVAALTKENGVDKASLKSAIDAASALKEADYTAESWKAAALADAIKAAQTVYDNKNATQAQVNAAIEALRTAQGKLVKKAPTLPTAPAGWTGWKQDSAGNYYFFLKGTMKKDYWVTDQSAHDLWYHVGSDGKLDTGFQYITDKTWGSAWFMLETSNANGMIGAALTGFQSTGSSAGEGYFQPKHNGHYAECTWTKAWGDYNAKTGVWGDGQQHVG